MSERQGGRVSAAFLPLATRQSYSQKTHAAVDIHMLRHAQLSSPRRCKQPPPHTPALLPCWRSPLGHWPTPLQPSAAPRSAPSAPQPPCRAESSAPGARGCGPGQPCSRPRCRQRNAIGGAQQAAARAATLPWPEPCLRAALWAINWTAKLRGCCANTCTFETLELSHWLAGEWFWSTAAGSCPPIGASSDLTVPSATSTTK